MQATEIGVGGVASDIGFGGPKEAAAHVAQSVVARLVDGIGKGRDAGCFVDPLSGLQQRV